MPEINPLFLVMNEAFSDYKRGNYYNALQKCVILLCSNRHSNKLCLKSPNVAFASKLSAMISKKLDLLSANEFRKHT